MAEPNERSGTARLRPRARLVGLMGEDLISDEPVAVVELVKNAYDADASDVTVSFDSEQSRIVVEDDGHGMDLDTVRTAWFELGTVQKLDARRSPGGRIYQGAKGIGRLASARLAESLLLETRTHPGADGVSVLFEWGQFDGAAYLDEIEIAWEVTEIPDLSQGTRLTLNRLRKDWSDDDFEALYSRLSRLISPFDDVGNFGIDLLIPAHTDWSGPVQPPQLLEEPRYLLRGDVDERGQFNGEIQHGREHVDFRNRRLGGVGDVFDCGPFSIEVRAWDRDPAGLDLLPARMMGMGIREIRRILDTYSGVSIYRDGFRVYPYGQRGTDWLNLDHRSRQLPVKRLANNQVVAVIRISRESNPGLRDRSNREGMVLNSEHATLERSFKEILSLLEEYRYEVRPRRKTARQQEVSLFEPFDIADGVAEARTTLGPDHSTTALITRLEEQVSSGVSQVQEVFSRLLMSAGLGQMVDMVIHEIGAPLGKISRQLVLVERALADTSDAATSQRIEPMIGSIKGWLEQLQNLRLRLDPHTAGRRGRATTFDVRDEVEDTFSLYGALLDAYGVTYQIRSPAEPIKVRMARSALSQVLANLVDNSIYWLGRASGGGKIIADARRRDSGFSVTVADDGPGVQPEDRQKIFEPYFSRKPNGVGLGLYISRLVIEPYGRLIYRDDCDLGGACFEAIFERDVGL